MVTTAVLRGGFFIFMIKTYPELIQSAKDYIVDNSSSNDDGLTPTSTLIQQEINNAVRELYVTLRNYRVYRDSTDLTEDGVRYYPLPYAFESMVEMTHTINDVAYPLQEVTSQAEWNRITQLNYSGTTYPQFFFVRKSDVGIYPTPQADGQTITMNHKYVLKDMTETTSTTGSDAEVSYGDATFTATGLTAQMVGRFVKIDDDGYWYRITSYTSSTSVELDKEYQGTTGSSLNYTIAEAPDIPIEFHPYIPFKVSGIINSTRRRDVPLGQQHLNYYYTGDFNNPNRDPRLVESGVIGLAQRYKTLGRSASQIVNRNKSVGYMYNEAWTTQISAS